MIELIPYGLLALKALLIALAIVFVISGVDELFIDLVKIGHSIRRFFVMLRHDPLTEAQLLAKPEQPVALMVPCWDESEVIGRMLENAVKTINYSNYVIFVGCYPNDPATIAAVDAVALRYAHVRRVLCENQGPTSKADNLNCVYAGVKEYEKTVGTRFQVFIMEDSEDILHPLTLKLFNYLIPRFDMVQIPVFPMEPESWTAFTAGTYLDEFSETHSRDMVAREALGAALPSAGVGTAYSAGILEKRARQTGGELFNESSMTEDYELGMRLGELGAKQIFVRVEAAREVVGGKTARTGGGRLRHTLKRDYVVIREFFPTGFWASVRQRGRWVLGIALQGWGSIGWSKGLANKYLLFRDRKTLLTNPTALLANILVPLLLLVWMLPVLFPEHYRYPPLVVEDSWLWTLLLVNLGFLVWRIASRFFYVWELYGLFQACMSLLRLPWANLINFLATFRAARMHVRHLLGRAKPRWDKTDHVFPTDEELRAFRRRLGDLLIERKQITPAQLEDALRRQKLGDAPLGAILADMGAASERTIVQVLGEQLGLQSVEVDPYLAPLDALRALPRTEAERLGVFPVGRSPGGALLLAAADPPPREALDALEAKIGQRVELRLAPRGDVAFALRRGYARLAGRDSARRLGDRLVAAGLLTLEQAQEALREQREPDRRLGDLLVSRGLISRADLTRALATAYASAGSAGSAGSENGVGDGDLAATLKSMKLVGLDELGQALEDLDRLERPIGEILVRKGLIDEATLARFLEDNA